MDLNESHMQTISDLNDLLSPSVVKFDILTVRRITLVKLKEVIDALLDSNNDGGSTNNSVLPISSTKKNI